MKHISGKIVLLVVATEIVAMAILFLVLNGRLTRLLEDRLVEDMCIIAHHRADLAETYIEGCCDFLNGYARSSEAVRALSEPDNADYIRDAREYTNRYAAGYDTIEGLYIASWDTYVLAHINPDSVDKTFRSSDILIRLGGDEFVVYAPGMPDEKTGTMVINRFIKNIESISPPSIKGHKVTVSLGAVMVTEEMTFSDMYNHADSLMYECKKKGGSAFAFYTE